MHLVGSLRILQIRLDSPHRSDRSPVGVVWVILGRLCRGNTREVICVILSLGKLSLQNADLVVRNEGRGCMALHQRDMLAIQRG